MYLPGLQQHLPVQPQVATRHFVLAAEGERDLFICYSKMLKTEKSKPVYVAHLFQQVPGFLCEVRWKAELAF